LKGARLCKDHSLAGRKHYIIIRNCCRIYCSSPRGQI